MILDVGVIALEEDGAWLGVVGAHAATGAADDRLIVDDGFAVEDDGDVAIDECEFVTVPFTAGSACVFGGSDAAEDSAGAFDPLHGAVVVDDLCFVHASEIYAAVAARFHLVFDDELEVFP